VNVTVNYPGKMTVDLEHTIGDRALVYLDGDDTRRALVLWLTPEVAAQWIEALTPLADKATP
jgi:hypothetical protein